MEKERERERKRGGGLSFLYKRVGEGGEKKRRINENLMECEGVQFWREIKVFQRRPRIAFFGAAGFSGFPGGARFLPGFLDFYSFIFCMRVWQRVR